MSNVIAFPIDRTHSTARAREIGDTIEITFFIETNLDIPPEDISGLAAREISEVLVKGLFAAYHMIREHRLHKANVSSYLLAAAKKLEGPIIPAAEQLFMDHFVHPSHVSWDVVPDDLLDMGLATAEDVRIAVHHAVRLDRFIQMFSRAPATSRHHVLCVLADEPRNVFAAFVKEHRSWASRMARLSAP